LPASECHALAGWVENLDLVGISVASKRKHSDLPTFVLNAYLLKTIVLKSRLGTVDRPGQGVGREDEQQRRYFDQSHHLQLLS